MGKLPYILALGLMGYITPVSAQTSINKVYEKETDSISMISTDSLVSSPDSLSLTDKVIRVLQDVGEKDTVEVDTLIGTRYDYEFDKKVCVDGRPYYMARVSYVQMSDSTHRIAIVLYDGDYDTTLQTFYDGLNGPLDGVPEKGVAMHIKWYKRPGIYFKAQRAKPGDLSYFGKNLKDITREEDKEKYVRILESFLKQNDESISKSTPR